MTLLNNDQAAEYLNVKPKYLVHARMLGTPNLPYIKVGALVRYDQADLDAYLLEHKVI